MNIGERYGRLTALKFSRRDKNSHKRWIFICDCGIEKELFEYKVKIGESKSCGCLRTETAKLRLTKHSQAKRGKKTRTYRIWINMRNRCNNPKATGYDRYGGAGIKVCDRWNYFENFLLDMGEVSDGMMIDRKDNSKGYEPENCRWATRIEQNNNRSSVRNIEFNGETHTVVGWAKKIGIDKSSMLERLDKWTLTRALSEEPNK